MLSEESSVPLSEHEESRSTAVEPNISVLTSQPKRKSLEEIEIDDVLRRLQTLTSGDSVFFKKYVLGNHSGSNELPISSNFAEGKVVCWTFDQLKQYIIISLRPYGALKFGYGDLYSMALAHDIYLHKLDTKVDGKRHDVTKIKDSSSTNHLSRRTDDITTQYMNDMNMSNKQITNDTATYYKGDTINNAIMSDVKTRPIPPGVETFCKCRFVSKIELVRKLRSIIRSNKQMFMERTMHMNELRLIITQNVRAYELEMTSYILGVNPWHYSSNPQDEPTPERVKEIIELYKSAIRNPVYAELYSKWKEYLKLNN